MVENQKEKRSFKLISLDMLHLSDSEEGKVDFNVDKGEADKNMQ